MTLTRSALVERARSPQGVKAIRYTLTSVVSVIVGQALLAFFQIVVDWTPTASNVASVCLASIPSYLLNRYWAWGKRGRNHLVKEVLPFWGLALLGLIVSTFLVDWTADHLSDSVLAVQAASLFAFGVLWLGKFIILNEVLFKHHPEVLEENPALDGHTGIPT
jgi:putative flippase GtrA